MANVPAPAPFDPSSYPAYFEAQRKEQIAQLLQQSLQNSVNSPDPQAARVGPYAVQARRGALQNIAPLVNALMYNRAQKSANLADAQYMAGPAQTSQDNSPPPPASIALPADQSSPMPQGNVAGTGVPIPAQPRRNPMVLAPDVRTAAQLYRGDPKGYMDSVRKQFEPTDIERQLNAAGITDPALRKQYMQQNLAKSNYIPPVDVRPGGTLVDSTGRPTFSAANNGVQTQYDPNTGAAIASNAVPGAAEAAAKAEALKRAADEGNTPHYIEDPMHPGQFHISYPTPPASMPSGAAGGATGPQAPKVGNPTPWKAPTAGDLSGTIEGGKQGVAYSSELAKNATGATEVRRSLSELKNLATQAPPGASNEPKMKLGSYMIAAGMEPDRVAKYLGVDIGALQAAQKQTATLAVNTIHSMTSRGTNFDLDTFMRNNPNMNMADPASFNRVVEYMDNKAKQEIDKQKDFVSWRKGVPAEEWESGHTAHWLDKQNQDIDAGKSNSSRPRPPLSSFVRQ